jgi:hypothetical protein
MKIVRKLKLVLVNETSGELDVIPFTEPKDDEKLTEKVMGLIYDQRWTLSVGDSIKIEERT